MKKCSDCGRMVENDETYCHVCLDNLERDAAREMGVEEYYDMTGKLPGDN